MKEINGKRFFLREEVKGALDFPLNSMFDEIDSYIYVKGMASVALFRSKNDFLTICRRDWDAIHLFDGLIQENPSITSVENPYEEGPFRYAYGFTATPYLLVDGANDAHEQLASDLDPFSENSEVRRDAGFGFADEREFYSLLDGAEEYEYLDVTTRPIEYYYMEEELLEFLKYRGIKLDAIPNTSTEGNSKGYTPVTEPASQSHIYRLLKGLIRLYYGSDIFEDLKLKKSKQLSEIHRDLDQAGYKFDIQTLRKYLKNLPD